MIAGRVLTADEGGPLGPARVALIPEQSGSDTQSYATISKSDGNFLLRDIKTGQKPELRPVAVGHTDDRGQYGIFGLKAGEYCLLTTDQVDPDLVGVIPVGEDFCSPEIR